MIKEKILHGTAEAVRVSGLGSYNLRDTLECGQAFRYEKLAERDGYIEYLTVISDRLVRVGQEREGELIFFLPDDAFFDEKITEYFSLNTDYEKIRQDITARTDSEWLMKAAEHGKGIVILKQDAWEALFSFIISQNNNIPRIRKIIRRLSSLYGKNLAKDEGKISCPLMKEGVCDEKCRECGICFSFPSSSDIVNEPEKMLLANPGFRYRYLLCAAKMVSDGEIRLDMIGAARSTEHTLRELKRIVGVGDKVASCVALFGFSNLDAFPVDVWMKRAIDEYFSGSLDIDSLGRYKGVAQQYIFHYIRHLENEKQI